MQTTANLIIDEDGTQEWYNKAGQRHRTGGPAIIYPIGTQHWIVNGKYHRTDGPAIFCQDSIQFWFVNGIRCKTNKSYQRHAKLSNEEMTVLVLKYGNIE